jgi:hypothetical protein
LNETKNITDNDGNSNEEFLFHQLLAMFQALALQQLGKLMNPITGKVERDLHQAKITIDMISMIQKKTEGNLTDREKMVVDNILLELRMNYVDESNRPDDEAEIDSEEDNPKVDKEDTALQEEDQPAGEEQVDEEPEK